MWKKFQDTLQNAAGYFEYLDEHDEMSSKERKREKTRRLQGYGPESDVAGRGNVTGRNGGKGRTRGARTDNELPSEELDESTPDIELRIDTRRNPILQADGLLDHLRSEYKVHIAEDKDQQCFTVVGTRSVVEALQNELAQITKSNSKRQNPGARTDNKFLSEEVDESTPDIELRIDTRGNPVLQADGLLDHLRSKYKVHIAEDKDQQCFIVVGTRSVVETLQNELAQITKSNSKRKNPGENTNHVTGAVAELNKPVGMLEGESTSNILVMDCHVWQYLREMCAGQLRSIELDCNVNMNTLVCVDIQSIADEGSKAETARMNLQKLVSSGGGIKKIRMCGIYDAMELKRIHPELLFVNEDNALVVLGPERDLKKLIAFLRDVATETLQFTGDTSSSMVTMATPRRVIIQEKKAYCGTQAIGELKSADFAADNKNKDNQDTSNEGSALGQSPHEKVLVSGYDTGSGTGARPKRQEGSSLSTQEILAIATTEFDKSDDDTDDEFVHVLRTPINDVTKSNVGKTSQMLNGYIHTKNKQKIILCTTDITKLHTGAIVNAANENLRHAGGVAKAISIAAGPQLQQQCDELLKKRKKPLEVCENVFTDAYLLPSQFVIHTVGPRWYTYKGDEKKASVDLCGAVLNVLKTAESLQIDSIALPAISSGNFGMPWQHVSKCIFDATMVFCSKSTKIKTILVVDLSRDILSMIRGKLSNAKTFTIMNDEDLHQVYAMFTNPIADVINRPSKEKKTKEKPSRGTTRSQEQEKGKNLPPMTVAYPREEGNRAHYKTEEPRMPQKKEETLSSEKVRNHREENNKLQYNPEEPPGNELVTDLHAGISSQAKLRAPDHTRQSGDAASNRQTAPDKQDVDGSQKNLNSGPEVECPICLSIPTKPHILSICKHTFCDACISRAFKEKPVCPVCSMAYGIRTGNQPDGKMTHTRDYRTLPGYEKCGTIVIEYTFPAGIQAKEHPNPGLKYPATTRIAYLPDTKEGKHVLKLLRRAFDARLVFTIGTSVTTGKDSRITWNDVHHKTQPSGGPSNFGYPDETYLKRVQEELAAKGIR